jgi:phage baseplate assembly protein V
MSEFAAYARLINRRFAEIETENEQLRLRLDNIFREGRVTKIDEATGKAEVDMNGLKSDALDISHRSGAIREWNPPAVGERVLVANPSGEPGMGIVLPGGYSDEFAQPHAKAGESFKTVGTTSILQTADKIVLTVGGSSLTLEGGKITLKTAKFEAVKG